MNQNFPTELLCLEMGEVTCLLHSSHRYPVARNTFIPWAKQFTHSFSSGLRLETAWQIALRFFKAEPLQLSLLSCRCSSWAGWVEHLHVSQHSLLSQHKPAFIITLKKNCWTLHLRHVRTAPARCFSAGMFSSGKRVVTNCGGSRSRRKKESRKPAIISVRNIQRLFFHGIAEINP